MALVPDFDGDFEAVLSCLEHVLCCVASLSVEDGRNQRQSKWLSGLGPAGDPQAAVARITAKVSSARGQRGRQFNPRHDYQHRPLCVVTLDSADVDLLGGAITALDFELAAGNDALNSMVNRCHLSLEQATQAFGVLCVESTGDTEALIAAIGDGEHDVTFSEALEDAYRATVARIQAIWNHDPCVYDWSGGLDAL